MSGFKQSADRGTAVAIVLCLTVLMTALGAPAARAAPTTRAAPRGPPSIGD